MGRGCQDHESTSTGQKRGLAQTSVFGGLRGSRQRTLVVCRPSPRKRLAPRDRRLPKAKSAPAGLKTCRGRACPTLVGLATLPGTASRLPTSRNRGWRRDAQERHVCTILVFRPCVRFLSRMGRKAHTSRRKASGRMRHPWFFSGKRAAAWAAPTEVLEEEFHTHLADARRVGAGHKAEG